MTDFNKALNKLKRIVFHNYRGVMVEWVKEGESVRYNDKVWTKVDFEKEIDDLIEAKVLALKNSLHDKD